MKRTRTKPDITILYEDNHLLVIDKPAGVLSQEDHTADPDVLTLCKQYIKKEYNKPGKVFLGLVHRLDRPVSGVMVLARTSKAASRLSEQIRNNEVKKTYWAVVEGITETKGKLVHHLAKNEKTNKVEAHNKQKGFTKRAELNFSLMKQVSDLTLLEVELITGRPHQIRTQFSKIGHPLWGDVKYGGKRRNKALGLRSMKLELTHPTTKERMTFEARSAKTQPWDMFEV